MRRLLRWLVVVPCLSFAAALVVLAVASRDGAMDVSIAAGGTYHDLRLTNGEWTLTLIANWPIEQPLEWGRREAQPAAPTNIPMTFRMVPLREALAVTLMPRTQNRWGPLRVDEGRVFIASRDLSAAFVPARAPTTMRMVTTQFVTPARPPRPYLPAPSPATLPAKVLEEILSPPPVAPSASSYLDLRPPTRASESAGGLIADLARDTELTFRSKPSTKPAPAPAGSAPLMFSSPAVPTRPYTMFALTQWLPLAISLLPVGWIATSALLRARNRRVRRRRGLCVACGYDLRGAPAHACPECGLLPA